MAVMVSYTKAAMEQAMKAQEVIFADRSGALAFQPGGLHGDPASTSARNHHVDSRAAPAGPIQCPRYGRERPQTRPRRGRGKDASWRVQNPTFPPRLEIPQRRGIHHSPTTPTAAARLTRTGQLTCQQNWTFFDLLTTDESFCNLVGRHVSTRGDRRID